MGNSHRHKSVKILKPVGHHWLCKTYWDKGEKCRNQYSITDIRIGNVQVVEEEKNKLGKKILARQFILNSKWLRQHSKTFLNQVSPSESLGQKKLFLSLLFLNNQLKINNPKSCFRVAEFWALHIL